MKHRQSTFNKTFVSKNIKKAVAKCLLPSIKVNYIPTRRYKINQRLYIRCQQAEEAKPIEAPYPEQLQVENQSGNATVVKNDTSTSTEQTQTGVKQRKQTKEKKKETKQEKKKETKEEKKKLTKDEKKEEKERQKEKIEEFKQRKKELLKMKPLPKYVELLRTLETLLPQQRFYYEKVEEVKMEFKRLILKNKDIDAKKMKAEQSELAAKELLTRLSADFENFRKRSLAEKKDIAKTEKADLVTILLPLIDNFELASNQIKAMTQGEQQINNSYQGLYRQMMDILRGIGVSTVDTVGTKFDPNFHEAVTREKNDEIEDGTVLEEFRKGFTINNKLIRPAMVKVSYRFLRIMLREDERPTRGSSDTQKETEATSSGSDWESEPETDYQDEPIDVTSSGSNWESEPETDYQDEPIEVTSTGSDWDSEPESDPEDEQSEPQTNPKDEQGTQADSIKYQNSVDTSTVETSDKRGESI